jgi:hypothetical protein
MLIAFVQLDRGRHGGAQALVCNQRLDAVLHRVVERISLQGFAVHLADQVGWHLAGAEAGHPHLRGRLLHFALHPRLDMAAA